MKVSGRPQLTNTYQHNSCFTEPAYVEVSLMQRWFTVLIELLTGRYLEDKGSLCNSILLG